jgi:hypothetical protein
MTVSHLDCRTDRIKQLRTTPKSRVGRPVVWSAESALLLMCSRR